MQNEFEKFVRVNRDAFDDEEPSNRVWKNIEKQFGVQEGKKIPVYKMFYARVASVAAVLLLALCVVYVSTKNTTTVIAKVNTADSPAVKAPIQAPPLNNDAPLAGNEPAKDSATNAIAQNTPGGEDEYKQEIFYYTKLTEIKFNQLKRIEKDDPVLYRNFAGEIQKLDSTYHGLQRMLTGNADNETVLNAMVANLKMQTEILTKQLYIIHKIKQSKKSKNENNYPSL